MDRQALSTLLRDTAAKGKVTVLLIDPFAARSRAVQAPVVVHGDDETYASCELKSKWLKKALGIQEASRTFDDSHIYVEGSSLKKSVDGSAGSFVMHWTFHGRYAHAPGFCLVDSDGVRSKTCLGKAALVQYREVEGVYSVQDLLPADTPSVEFFTREQAGARLTAAWKAGLGF